MNERAFEIQGDVVTVLARSAAGRFEMARIETGPGRGPPPHHHVQEEVVTCLAGALDVLADGSWRAIGPGGRVVLRPHALHAWRATAPDTVLEVLMAPEGLIAFYEDLHRLESYGRLDPAGYLAACDRHGVALGAG